MNDFQPKPFAAALDVFKRQHTGAHELDIERCSMVGKAYRGKKRTTPGPWNDALFVMPEVDDLDILQEELFMDLANLQPYELLYDANASGWWTHRKLDWLIYDLTCEGELEAAEPWRLLLGVFRVALPARPPVGESSSFQPLSPTPRYGHAAVVIACPFDPEALVGEPCPPPPAQRNHVTQLLGLDVWPTTGWKATRITIGAG